jgi:CDP-diacylglycerol---serine O-phosphatidyltransferase
MEELTPHRRESDRPRGKLRKGMYILPSLFTTANIAPGFYAILQTVHGSPAEPWHLDFAAMAIGFAVLFDGLDGRIARMTHTASDFGRELDSLADVITFGVAPALLAWMWGFHLLPGVIAPDLHLKITQGGRSPASLFSSPARAAWRASILRKIRSLRIRDVRGRNILWACRFRRGRE